MNSPNSVAQEHSCFQPSERTPKTMKSHLTARRQQRRKANVVKISPRSLTNTTSSITCSSQHSQVLRKRYLNRIGIFQDQISKSPTLSGPAATPVPYQSVTPRPAKMENTHIDSRGSPPSFAPVPLLRRSSTASTETATSCSSSNRKAVSFRDQPPAVHWIPTRKSYPRHVRHQLWISREEMRTNYARNVLEFRSENCNYRQSVEEDQFVRVGNELVHPVHFCLAAQQQHCHQQQATLYGSPPKTHTGPTNLKNHFCRVMSAQQRR